MDVDFGTGYIGKRVLYLLYTSKAGDIVKAYYAHSVYGAKLALEVEPTTLFGVQQELFVLELILELL